MATPVGAVADEVRAALEAGTGLVTDVGSVKTPMLELMGDPRYVGGHPMAGSELEGVDGSRADLFEGATWVLTPVSGTDDAAFTTHPIASWPRWGRRWWPSRRTGTTRWWPRCPTCPT